MADNRIDPNGEIPEADLLEQQAEVSDEGEDDYPHAFGGQALFLAS